MSFNDFVQKNNLKNKATSIIGIYEVLKNLGLDSKVGIYLRDGDFSTIYGIVRLHLSKGTHWVCYLKENYFESYGCSLPNKLSKIFIKRCRQCLSSEYKKQGLTNKRDTYCPSFCLYIIYLTKVKGVDFQSVALNLYF